MFNYFRAQARIYRGEVRGANATPNTRLDIDYHQKHTIVLFMYPLDTHPSEQYP